MHGGSPGVFLPERERVLLEQIHAGAAAMQYTIIILYLNERIYLDR